MSDITSHREKMREEAKQLQTHTPTKIALGLLADNLKTFGYSDQKINFIVRAVNAHREMLDACRKASAMVNYYRRAVMTGQIVGSHPGALVTDDYDVMVSLEKAIAEAEGE